MTDGSVKKQVISHLVHMNISYGLSYFSYTYICTCVCIYIYTYTILSYFHIQLSYFSLVLKRGFLSTLEIHIPNLPCSSAAFLLTIPGRAKAFMELVTTASTGLTCLDPVETAMACYYSKRCRRYSVLEKWLTEIQIRNYESSLSIANVSIDIREKSLWRQEKDLCVSVGS